MGNQIDDRFRNLTFERWRELARREPASRAAARQWLVAALVSSLRRAVKGRIASRPTPRSAARSLRADHYATEVSVTSDHELRSQMVQTQ